MTKRFYLNALKSPTYYKVVEFLALRGWKPTPYKWRAHFSEDHFDFSIEISQCLEFKHLLSDFIQNYCPQVMPLTYSINDQNAFEILEKIKNKNRIWILKPSLQNNGQNIKIFENLNEVKKHYSHCDRLGGEHVLQEYILNPHLLQGPKAGHKYSLRLFVVMTNNSDAYLYPQGYFNVALNPYQVDDFQDQRSHLTNEHLQGHSLNVVQISTSQYPVFKEFYPQIKRILDAIAKALEQHYSPQKERRLALFGFDFMVDSAMKVWLLEANHGPCFPIDPNHPLQKKVYEPFWHALIESFILPIGYNSQVTYVEDKGFEKLN